MFSAFRNFWFGKVSRSVSASSFTTAYEDGIEMGLLQAEGTVWLDEETIRLDDDIKKLTAQARLETVRRRTFKAGRGPKSAGGEKKVVLEARWLDTPREGELQSS
ncbi:unnamed protein product [Sympodiomycopsis kandeliae]